MRAWLLVLACAGCLAADAGPDGGSQTPADAGGSSGQVVVAVSTPAAGTVIHRDYLAVDGRWIARVTFKAQVTPAVASVDWMSGGLVQGVGLPPDYAFTESFLTDGAQTFEAVVHDAHDQVLGRAQVAIQIAAPTADTKDCAAKLGVLGVAFSAGPATMGIVNPITLTLPLKGMPFTSAGVPQGSLVMDCDLALALWRLVDVLAAHHVTSLGESGVYIYRCVSGSEQPPCAQSGFSLHAFGQAFDIASLTLDDGSSLSVKDDWVIDKLTGDQTTCTTPIAEPGKNQKLHDILCDVWGDKIFPVMLTPNFNATQPFVHVDLTPDMQVLK
jgi:hypothetical protein